MEGVGVLEDQVVVLDQSLGELRQTFRSGKTRNALWRKGQIRGILDLLRQNEKEIFKALHEDLGKHPTEAYAGEVGVVEKSARHSLSQIDKWMAPKKVSVPLILFPGRGEVLAEPLGLVLIIVPWNFPIYLALDPLIGALSAGNTVVLKLSELAPACSSFLANTIPRYLDNKAVKIIEGGPDTGNHLLQHKWDKIFFTGSPHVGKIVMSAAAKHLTPVTVESGGKCPAILDSLASSSDFKVAARRIAAAKWSPCCGQTCIAIDYLLVEDKFASHLIALLEEMIVTFFGENRTNLRNISRIVNKNHFERLRKLLTDPTVAASIVYGGSLDEEKLMIEPTILLNPPLDADIMSEEIFGPLLPIITLDNIQESIAFINSKPKPLAIYAFTQDESFKKQVLSQTSSGSVTFNDAIMQFLCEELPFGGVGQSGFGRYHGKYSFDTFSHEKAVLRRGFFPEIPPRYPPWNDFKMQFLRLVYSYDYLGLVLLVLRLRRWR